MKRIIIIVSFIILIGGIVYLGLFNEVEQVCEKCEEVEELAYPYDIIISQYKVLLHDQDTSSVLDVDYGGYGYISDKEHFYTLMDINNDGSDELIISYKFHEEDNYNLISVYKITDGLTADSILNMVNIFAGDRSFVSLYDNGYMYNRGNNSAYSGGISIFGDTYLDSNINLENWLYFGEIKSLDYDCRDEVICEIELKYYTNNGRYLDDPIIETDIIKQEELDVYIDEFDDITKKSDYIDLNKLKWTNFAN